jgi:hypothetical protein
VKYGGDDIALGLRPGLTTCDEQIAVVQTRIRNLSPQTGVSAISIAHHVATQRNGEPKAYATGNGEPRWPSEPFVGFLLSRGGLGDRCIVRFPVG